jgi:hypothetical protein
MRVGIKLGGSISNKLRLAALRILCAPRCHGHSHVFRAIRLPQAFNLLENTLSRATVLVDHELLVALQHFQSSQTTR